MLIVLLRINKSVEYITYIICILLRARYLCPFKRSLICTHIHRISEVHSEITLLLNDRQVYQKSVQKYTLVSA